jgi:hypothetical protein
MNRIWPYLPKEYFDNKPLKIVVNKKNEKEMLNVWIHLPRDIVHKILGIYKQIIYKNGRYTFINEIKVDYRYQLFKVRVLRQVEILAHAETSDYGGFYFEFDFPNGASICYDYNFSYNNKFEICYADWRPNDIIQIRTIIH